MKKSKSFQLENEVKCNCTNCRRKRIMECKPSFPRMVWFTEHSLFNGAIFARNYNDFLFLMDELRYAVKYLDNEL